MYEYFGWYTNLLSIICCEEKALLCRMYLLLTNFHVGYDITMLYILYFMCRILVKKVLFCKIMAYLLQKHFLVDMYVNSSYCYIFRALRIMSVNSFYYLINNISIFYRMFWTNTYWIQTFYISKFYVCYNCPRMRRRVF